MSNDRKSDSRSSGGFRATGPRDMHMGPREMFKTTCADCKQETEVPFKPSGDRPVYCRECYQNHRPKRF
ncbi:MAG: hypothetical protein OIN86_11160 [Candidatus Methanoperedens sp.]|jgi:CxxC-x17-CxxC domain-containing protein|nr:hypothetical protein [Candidatus Methanoperedens sp.]CAG1005868.1 hypothetical protein METP1_03284 [Methanosarcinales archaeon]